jgi:hypothetical protein
LFDFIDRVQELSSRVGSLDKLNELIDLEVFPSKLVEILDYGDHEKGERPPWESAPLHTSETLHYPSLLC